MPAGDTQDRYGNLIRNMRGAVAIYVEEGAVQTAALLNGALAELESQRGRLARQGELLNQSGQRESRLLKRVEMLSTALDAARKETTTLMRQLKECESTQDAWEKDLGS
jgi:bacterioferritin (cytochrome b1)